MKDGPFRRAIKRVTLAINSVNLAATRAIQRARGEKPFLLGGNCRLCAKCCEEPSIHVGRIVWYFPTARRLFLTWQRRINGFRVKDRIISERVFVFECTHFDPETRRCDSYESRPLMCRDYPRGLLWQTSPTMIPGCGYRPVDPNAKSLLAAIEHEDLTEEQRTRLKEKLHLED